MKPEAVICDIDGTLALRGERDPHDLEHVGDDKVNRPVAVVLRALYAMGYRIVFTSGRQESCRPATKQWIEDNTYVESFDLHMRGNHDGRPDSEVKREMLDIVRLDYQVFLVLDDRDSVVKMWRDNHIPTWQVNWGEF